MKYIKEVFAHMVESGKMRFNEILAPYTSFHIGGPADVFAMPDTQKELIDLLIYAIKHDIKYFILGKGTNLLVSDRGFRGIVISMEAFRKITRDENFVSAFAGVELKKLCEFTQQEGLAGLEFACGIPGSVGGAVFMNAGAYDGEIANVLYCSKCLIADLENLQSSNPILHLRAHEHDFSYRMSAFQKRSLIHLSSVFKLKEDDPSQIIARMNEYDNQRQSKQPLDLPSAGSVFKRPQGYFTGKLIDECGLRGYRIGDAAISSKHCGFIVNLGNATAQDVLSLIQYVQDTVYRKFGVRLQTELRTVGEF
nr:UDP-N-acetylmuramate dehydrogenase [Candidatus Cloacimonadota bacterium]